MKKRISWRSPETISLVEKEIQASPENLQKAFRAISDKLGCTVKAVQGAYYGTGGPALKNTINGFKTSSDKKSLVNIKIVKQTNPEKLLHESVVSSKEVEGLRVVTIRKIFVI